MGSSHNSSPGQIAFTQMVALEVVYTLEICETRLVSELKIFSHRQSAISSFMKLIISTRHDIRRLTQHNISITAIWICVHTNLIGNYLTDSHTNRASYKALNQPTHHAPKSVTEIKSSVSRRSSQKWQKSWDSIDTGHNLYLP